MYDPRTLALVENAPPLEGLNLSKLPRRLARDYATIVSLRVRITEAQGKVTMPSSLRKSLARLRSLANTYEAYVSLLSRRDDKASAAFVSASARHLLSLASQLDGKHLSASDHLDSNAISCSLSAMLLFVISGQPADAAEVAKTIAVGPDVGVRSSLLSALCNLAIGALTPIVQDKMPAPPGGNGEAWDELGSQVLWYRLLLACRGLAQRLLGQPGDPAHDPQTMIRQVVQDSVRKISVARDKNGSTTLSGYSRFAGPHHLAVLLDQAAGELRNRAVVSAGCPSGVDGGE